MAICVPGQKGKLDMPYPVERIGLNDMVELI
jgi:hypothetical protein